MIIFIIKFHIIIYIYIYIYLYIKLYIIMNISRQFLNPLLHTGKHSVRMGKISILKKEGIIK